MPDCFLPSKPIIVRHTKQRTPIGYYWILLASFGMCWHKGHQFHALSRSPPFPRFSRPSPNRLPVCHQRYLLHKTLSHSLRLRNGPQSPKFRSISPKSVAHFDRNWPNWACDIQRIGTVLATSRCPEAQLCTHISALWHLWPGLCPRTYHGYP